MDDEEIDWDRFISGIYNYCDRWCERCAYREKCYLWHEEQKRLQQHLLRGEDPNDMEVVMADVSASFKKTLELLMKMAEEMGIDLDDSEPVSERDLDAYQEHSLYQATMRLERSYGPVREADLEEMPRAANAVISAFERGDLHDELLAVGRLQGVSDDVELLMRYRFLIPAKVARAVQRDEDEEEDAASGPGEDPAGPDEEEGENMDMDHAERPVGHGQAGGRAPDEDGSGTLAPWRVRAEWLQEAMLCAGGAESVRTEIGRAFPRLASFRRPGFDENT